MVQVAVWEAASGGLFSSQSIAGVTAGSHSASILEQVVSCDGNITVPYAGNLHVVGRTPHQVEAMIVSRLGGKAIEPQAIVTVPKNASSTATVLGEVNVGARIPLSLRGDRVLDVIASAGGIRAPIPELFIALSRSSVTRRVPMQALVARPAENIYVHPNDVVTVIREPQAFGATGRNALVPFDAIGISLEEAVAKAGGLLDYTAAPQGVFLLRSEPADITRWLDPSYPVPEESTTVNVLYRVNLKDANSYFMARHFSLPNKDVVYVAASPSIEFQKALSLFTGVTTSALGTATAGAAL